MNQIQFIENVVKCVKVVKKDMNQKQNIIVKNVKKVIDYFVIKGNELNCYNKKCNIQNSNYREIENTHECLETGCNSIYKYEYNGEKCFSKCPENTISN